MKKSVWLCVGFAILMACSPVWSQTVLYSNDFDGLGDGVIPEGWTHVEGVGHQPAKEDPTCGWMVISPKRFVAFDFGSGDQVRDQMGYYRLADADGNPDTTIPVGDFLSILNPPPSGNPNWRRQGGDRSPWKNPPFVTLGQQADGTYPDTAGILVGDSDQYGGANVNLAIDSNKIAVNGSKWVRINYDYFFYANQDQSAGSWYRLDNGPWQPLLIADNQSHGDDQGYAGYLSFAVNAEGAQTIQLRWWLAGNFSWFLVVDNLELVGYNNLPDGPAQPSILEPIGSVDVNNVTKMKSSAFNDPTGGKHVFSEWEVRHDGGTYGNCVQFDQDGVLFDMPVLRTSLQPNEYAVNSVNPDDAFGNADSARDANAPFEPILFGRERPGAQFKIDLKGDQTILDLPPSLFRPGTKYFARVRHWNDKGIASPWSNEAEFSINPVASKVVFEENFDQKTSTDSVYDRLNSAGWVCSWFDTNLNTLQVLGDKLEEQSSTETDARGLNGHFDKGVLHAQDVYIGPVTTPAINNSTGGDLTLIFDSAWRSNCNGTLQVLINDNPTATLLEIGQKYITQFSDMAANQIVYNNTYVYKVAGTAGQSNVKFQWDFVDGFWWTIDNVSVQSGEPVDVESWELF